MSPHTPHDGFNRALAGLEKNSWKFVDAEQFASDTETNGLLSLPGDLTDHFGPKGDLRRDVTMQWRGGITAWLQLAFARQGLIVEVPGQGPETDSLISLSEQNWR